MDKLEVIKIMLVYYVTCEVENNYTKYHKSFMRAQEDNMDTVPDAIGEDIFDLAVNELDNALTFKEGFEDIYDNSDFDEKDIAFYLLELENDMTDEAKDLVSFDETLFDNKAYHLMLAYHENQNNKND